MNVFRITVEGFTVHQQTWDDALNRDGWADEVYVTANVSVVDQAGSTLIPNSLRSKTMGDINGFPSRVQAGSATTHGGLQTGDEFPYPSPWVRQDGTSPSANQLPMTLFQGTLAPKQEAVVIIPTIWEWDGSAGLLTLWEQTIVTNAPQLAASAINIVNAINAGGVPSQAQLNYSDFIKNNLQMGLPPLFAIVNDITGQAKNRPIGMQKENGSYSFKPSTLLLTAELAEVLITKDLGLGVGVFALPYKDDPSIGGGEYSLYLKVEKLWDDDENLSNVIVYKDANFSAPSQTLAPGRYDVGQLTDNDVISSLHIPRGWTVTLYEHAGFQGRSQTFTSDTPYVGDAFNDIASSIIVHRPAVVYADANYAGTAQTLAPGRYDVGQLTVGNDSISSLKVPDGWTVTLYENAGFQGRSQTFTSDTPYVGDAFNDIASSIIVQSV